MPKYSVKKPYTILVLVIAVIVIGYVALTSMTLDLLPQISLPYLIVIASYPGASVENVEKEVALPLESALGTINGVAEITSISNENYAIVELEFEDDTDMDTALVKVTAALNTARSSLPENAGTPQIMEVSMDMVATMYAAVSREDYDIYNMSDFAETVVIPSLERQEGIASVSGTGLVEKSIQVELKQEKMDEVKQRILDYVSQQLEDGRKQLDDAMAQVEQGEKELENSRSSFGETLTEGIMSQMLPGVQNLADRLGEGLDQVSSQVQELEGTYGIFSAYGEQLQEQRQRLREIRQESSLTAMLGDLIRLGGDISQTLSSIRYTIQAETSQLPQTENPDVFASLYDAIGQADGAIDALPGALDGIGDMGTMLSQAQLDAAYGFSTAASQLSAARAKLDEALAAFESQKDQALAAADLSQMFSAPVLSQLIYAQNFEMPAGYVDDEKDGSWLLKVGDTYDTQNQLVSTVLASVDGIGDIRLSDVAEITVIDNAMDSYARVNGDDAVILAIYKSGSAGTNDAANNILDAFAEMEGQYEGLSFTILMNQGEYIALIISSVLSSMLVGALLAIIVLALFLKDVKPTIVVAVSIPLSVLTAIVCMYFSGLSMNMMTLSGLALGIGMLVDNSVVVMENIYRLRSRGIDAPRAAVQGTKQVAGSIISSTLTTICVFMPMLFASGMVRELLVPMGLTITYTLTASLAVAMTVVPASASTLLKDTKQKEHPWFDKMTSVYARVLNFFLDFKLLPILASSLLLALSVYLATVTGIVIIPDMNAGYLQVQATMPDVSREEAYQLADEAMQRILAVEDVDKVGMMTSSSTAAIFTGMSAGSSDYHSYAAYVLVKEGTSTRRVRQMKDEINAMFEGDEISLTASLAGMSDLGSLMSSGLTLNVYGENEEKTAQAVDEIKEIIGEVEGFENIYDSRSAGAAQLAVEINRNKAMEKGITVAEVYQKIAMALVSSASNTSIADMDVVVVNHDGALKKEDLNDFEIDAKGTKIRLSEIASIKETTSPAAVYRANQRQYLQVGAGTAEGYNTTLLSRELEAKLKDYTPPEGVTYALTGESEQVNEMIWQMAKMAALGLVLIYLVMVAQFQSLLSPFIAMFTIPLAFTGGFLGLLAFREPLSIIALMGFIVLMGTVVNNGIVFVDYTNQLRLQGLDRRTALTAAGQTRMRPIWMTALTTILAMTQLMIGDSLGAQMSRGMAIVIAAGLLYATFMTLFMVPVMYDIFFKRPPLEIDVGSDENLEDIVNDAEEYMQRAENV